jgi:hypothetical protein
MFVRILVPALVGFHFVPTSTRFVARITPAPAAIQQYNRNNDYCQHDDDE